MANFKIFSYAKLSVSSRHIRVLGQFQINKKLTSKQTQQTQQQTFPSFPHNLHFFPTAKPNATYIFVLILANDELFEFCVSCGEFGGNMKVFVEFVLRLIFVDLKLSQNPYMPTTFFTAEQIQERFGLSRTVFFNQLCKKKTHFLDSQEKSHEVTWKSPRLEKFLSKLKEKDTVEKLMHSQARKGMPKSYAEINAKMNQCVENYSLIMF